MPTPLAQSRGRDILRILALVLVTSFPTGCKQGANGAAPLSPFLGSGSLAASPSPGLGGLLSGLGNIGKSATPPSTVQPGTSDGLLNSDQFAGINSASGVLNLPVMAQSSGGDEAAVRGCGPTSLLMATGRANPTEIQPVLEATCDRPGGLVAERAVAWLKQNGYPNSAHYYDWTVDMLREETMVRRNPVLINFINPNTGNGHIVVVVGVTNQGVHINDPGPGQKRVLSVSQFQNQWKGRNEYAIPVRA